MYPVSSIQYPVSCILYPVPCIQYPVSSILYPEPCIQYTVSNILHQVSCIQYPASSILHPVTCIQYPESSRNENDKVRVIVEKSYSSLLSPAIKGERGETSRQSQTGSTHTHTHTHTHTFFTSFFHRHGMLFHVVRQKKTHFMLDWTLLEVTMKYGSSVCVMQWTGVIRDGTLI